MGDYLYCPRHPGQIVSNGLFDAPCGACEGEMEDDYQRWQYDPTNAKRPYCQAEAYIPAQPWYGAATCLDVPDDIPF